MATVNYEHFHYFKFALSDHTFRVCTTYKAG